MPRLLSIGGCSRIAHLSVKALRHYDEVGLLAPRRIDEGTSYRYYASEQLPMAQVIRRLRALEMSVPAIKAVLEAPDAAARHALLARHLDEREAVLAHAQATVDSLRTILQRGDGTTVVTYRSIPATPALAIRAAVDLRDLGPWWRGAVGELHATLGAGALRAAGSICGQYDASLFNEGHGGVLVYAPVEDASDQRPVGRTTMITVPAAELAVVVHAGGHENIDVAYGDLARHVTTREVAVEGPLREAYLRGPIDSPEPSDWVTEIGWPIFRVNAGLR